MPSQWNKLCAIIKFSEKLPAEQKSEYLQHAFAALAFESHTNISTRDLKSMKSKMQHKTNGQKPRKKRRAAT